MKKSASWVVVWGAALGIACGDPLKEAQRIEELRVLGAQVRVVDAEQRATPEPGDAVVVEWLLADPSGLPPETLWAMQACAAEDTGYGVPMCRQQPFASAEQAMPAASAPSLAFEVPPRAELEGAERLALLAIFCDDGELELGPNLEASSCAGARTVQRASLDIFLSDDTDSNDNPDLSEARVELSGDPWPALEGPIDCEGGALSTLPADGRAHRITLDPGARAREFQERPLDEVALESLQISHFSTLGALDRRFSNVAPDDSNLEKQLTWTAPKDIDTTTPATFHFVVRDGRGGTSWLTRTLCVEP